MRQDKFFQPVHSQRFVKGQDIRPAGVRAEIAVRRNMNDGIAALSQFPLQSLGCEILIQQFLALEHGVETLQFAGDRSEGRKALYCLRDAAGQ